MPRIPIRDDQLAPELLARAAKLPGVLSAGLNDAALLGQRMLKQRTPRNLGHTADRWKVRKSTSTKSAVVPPEIYNEAPHIGVLEMGARPHPVSAEGVAAITFWAQRKLGLDYKEAKGVAYVIARRIRAEGTPATYFVRDSMDELRNYVGIALDQAIRAYARQRAKR